MPRARVAFAGIAGTWPDCFRAAQIPFSGLVLCGLRFPARSQRQHGYVFEVQPSGLPSFLNSTEHFVEDWLCCQQMGELSDQRL